MAGDSLPIQIDTGSVPHCIVCDLTPSQRDPERALESPLPQLIGGSVSAMLDMYLQPFCDMHSFWEGYRRPLATLGIYLCSLNSNNAWTFPRGTSAIRHPMAYRCLHEQPDEPPGGLLLNRFAYAQDGQRDAVIKLIDKGSMEHSIYKCLAECNSLYDNRAFVGVLPPTAIIGSPYNFSFVVMPRWGTKFPLDKLDSIRQVMIFIRCTLSGLSFLHQHRIAHRDIDETNILINWYCDDFPSEGCTQRLREHSRSPSAAYALFDFDLSLQLPLDMSLTGCRRPAWEAFTGKQFYHPVDVYQGARHYNPFAFDVACLGNLYLCWFKEAIPVVPLLAPFIGRMTTHAIDQRWTAEEALSFFHELEGGLPSETLDSRVSLQFDLEPMGSPELYWDKLSPELQARWKSHRPPPLSWTTRLLRWLNTTEVGYAVVAAVRRFLRI